MKKAKRGSLREASAAQPAETADDGAMTFPVVEPQTGVIAPEFGSVAPGAASIISDEEIRQRAYELYEQRDGDGGDHVSDWLAAERELKRLSSI